MQIKTKFRCDAVTHYVGMNEAQLNAVYGGSPEKNVEDNQFSSATPSGKINITISNPSTMDFIQPGKKYYVYFEECPDQN